MCSGPWFVSQLPTGLRHLGVYGLGVKMGPEMVKRRVPYMFVPPPLPEAAGTNSSVADPIPKAIVDDRFLGIQANSSWGEGTNTDINCAPSPSFFWCPAGGLDGLCLTLHVLLIRAYTWVLILAVSLYRGRGLGDEK